MMKTIRNQEQQKTAGMDRRLFNGRLEADNFGAEYGAIFALLKTRRALEFDLEQFRACSSSSLKANQLWNQCEARLQEIELYEEMIPDDISVLIMTHILRSRDVKLWHR